MTGLFVPFAASEDEDEKKRALEPKAIAPKVAPAAAPLAPKPENPIKPEFLAFPPTQDETRSALSAAAATVKPDDYASDLAMSRKTGLPADVIERNREEVAREQAAQESAEALDGTASQRWMLQSPDNLKVASDAGPSLVSIETAVGAFQSFGAKVVDFAGSIPRGAGITNDIMARSIGAPIYAGLEAIGAGDVVQAMKNALPWWLDPGQILQRPGQEVGKVADLMEPENPNFITDVAGGVGQMAAQITALVLLGPAAAVPMLLGSGVDQAAKEADKEGALGTPGGDTAAVAGGAITAATERFGLNLILDRIPAAVKSRVGRILAGGSTEMVQEISEKVLNNLTALALYNPDAEIFGEDTLYEGEVGGTVGAIVSAIIPGKRAIKARKAMDDVKKEIDKSPLTERDPEKAAEHATEVLKDAGIQVYVSADALYELAGANTVEETREFFDKLGVGEQLEAALERGGDVKLSEEAFAKHILLTDNYEKIADEIRFGATEMTAKEAGEAAGDLAEERKVSRDATDADNPPEITEGMKAKLKVQGFSDEDIAKMPVKEASDLLGIPASEPVQQIVTLAEEQMGLQALFKTAKEAGMTETQYSQYLVAVAQAREAGVKRQQAAMLRQEQREASAEYQAEREIQRQQIEENVGQRPVYAALDGLNNVRLDREAVVDIMTAEAGGRGVYDLKGDETMLGALPKQGSRQIYAAKGEPGIHPDIHAQRYGFEDGATMLREIAHATPKAQVIEAETDLAMREKHPDLGNRQQAVRSAIEALHNDTQAEVLAAELHALQGAKKDKRLSPKLFRAAAKERLLSVKVGEILPSVFFSTMARKGRDAGKAIRKNDRPTAIRAKFQQLMNFQFAKEAYSVRPKIEGQRKRLEKLLKKRKKHRGIDADHLQRARDMLAPYSLVPPASNAQRLKLMAEAQEAAAQSGEPVKIPPRLVRDDSTTHYTNMTLNEWNTLYAAVMHEVAQGRRWKQYFVQGALKDFEDVKAGLLEATAELPDVGRVAMQQAEQNPKIGVRKALAAWSATLGKVEFMLRKLDGGNLVGAWHKAVFAPAAEAQTAELDLFKRTLAPLEKGLKKLSKEAQKRMKTRVFVEKLGRTFSGSDIFMMALNAGNESNYTKMIEGANKDTTNNESTVAWTDEGVQDALSRLGPEEAALVQQIWDNFEKMRPAVEKIYANENGVTPDRVEPREVEIAGVKLKGGYFPLMYDPSRASAKPKQSVLEMMEDPYIQGSVFSGMTKARTEGYSAPVLLDIAGLSHALRQHIHFITHYEAVKNVRQILRDDELQKAIRNKLGTEYHKELEKWLEAVATNGADNSQAQDWNAIFTALRRNLTAAILGFSYTTGVSQLLGAFTSSAVIGGKWVAVGYDHYLANPAQATREAMELSGELRHRLGNSDRDINEALLKIAGRKGFWATQQRASLMMIGGIQLYTVDIPTWLGAYNKALAENRSDSDAVLYADSALRTSQASGHIKDLSAIQRQKGFMTWVTMFSTYTMLLYNLQAEAIGSMRKIRNVPGAVAKMGWMLAAPAVADALLRAELPGEDDDDLAWWSWRITRNSLASVPVVGQGLAGLLSGYSFRFSSVEQLGSSWLKGFKALYKVTAEDEDFTPKKAGELLKPLGLTFGVGGTSQMVRALDAMDAGEDLDLYRLLVGPEKKK